MHKKLKYLLQMNVSILIAVSLIGCATIPENISLKKDLTTISKIVAIGNSPPEIKRIGGSTIAVLIFTGGLGAGIEQSSAGNRMMETYSLPDYGQLVLDKFLDHAHKEIRNWPEVIVQQDVEKAKKVAEGQFFLEISPIFLVVRYIGRDKGLNVMTSAQLKDPSGEVIWQSSFCYISKNYGRDAQSDKFEEYGGKLLKEEWNFAAEETAKKLISGLDNL